MAADAVKNPDPINPQKYEVITSIRALVDWNNRVVQFRQHPANGLILTRPVVMLVPIDDMMILGAQILQLQSQHNKALMAQAMKAGIVSLGPNGGSGT